MRISDSTSELLKNPNVLKSFESIEMLWKAFKRRGVFWAGWAPGCRLSPRLYETKDRAWRMALPPRPRIGRKTVSPVSRNTLCWVKAGRAAFFGVPLWKQSSEMITEDVHCTWIWTSSYREVVFETKQMTLQVNELRGSSCHKWVVTPCFVTFIILFTSTFNTSSLLLQIHCTTFITLASTLHHLQATFLQVTSLEVNDAHQQC